MYEEHNKDEKLVERQIDPRGINNAKYDNRRMLLPEIRELLEENPDGSELENKLKKLQDHYPPSSWALISEQIPFDILKIAFLLWDGKDKAEMLLKSDRNTIETMLYDIDNAAILDAANLMDVSSLELLSDRISSLRFSRILASVNSDAADELRVRRSHGKDEAGRYMSFDFICVYTGSTLAEAILQFRMMDISDNIQEIFVINKYGEVVGYCPLYLLFKVADSTIISDIMTDLECSIRTDEPIEKVIRVVERLQLTTVPVVDNEGQLIGVISYAGILEMMNDVARDTVDAMAGTYSEEESGVLVSVVRRLPWLLMTICSGILSAFAIAFFGSRIGARMSLIMFFIPLITGMTGNIGIQSSTMMVRRIAISGLSRNIQFCSKEVKTGAITGIGFGCLLFMILFCCWGYTFPWTAMTSDAEISPVIMGLCVGSGMLVASLWASGLGVIAPLLFEWAGVDPALASGPIVTALNDVVAMIIYLNITRMILMIYDFLLI